MNNKLEPLKIVVYFAVTEHAQCNVPDSIASSPSSVTDTLLDQSVSPSPDHASRKGAGSKHVLDCRCQNNHRSKNTHPIAAGCLLQS